MHLAESVSDTFKMSSHQQILTNTFQQEKRGVVRSRKTHEDAVKEETADSLVTKHEKHEDLEILRQFDLNLEFGPCTGITRLERWERAFKHDLNPPTDVRDLILLHQDDPDYAQSLWKDYEL